MVYLMLLSPRYDMIIDILKAEEVISENLGSTRIRSVLLFNRINNLRVFPALCNDYFYANCICLGARSLWSVITLWPYHTKRNGLERIGVSALP